MSLEMFEIVIKMLEVENNRKKASFLKQIILLTNLSIDVVQEKPFPNLNNLKINFVKLKIFQQTYSLINVISIIKHVKLIKNKNFANAVRKQKKNFEQYIWLVLLILINICICIKRLKQKPFYFMMFVQPSLQIFCYLILQLTL